MNRIPLFCGIAVSIAAAVVAPRPAGARAGDGAPGAAVRVFLRAPSDRAALARFGSVVEDYGSFVIARMGDAEGRAAAAAGLDVEAVDQRIGVGNYRFDPLEAVPSVPAALADAGADGAPGYVIVQFRGPARPEWLSRAAGSGAEVLAYLPENAFLVRATPAEAGAVAAAREVRWVGAFHPAYKLSEDLAWVAGLGAPRTQAPRQRYHVGVFHGPPLAEVTAAIARLGGAVDMVQDLRLSYFTLLRVEIDTDRVAELAALRDVCRVETWYPHVRDDERANQVLAGNYVGTTVPSAGYAGFLSARGANGLNVTVGVVDDGVTETESHLNGRAVSVLRGASAGATGHGHHCASIIAGNCTHALDSGGFQWAGGMAPAANVINIPLLKSGYGGSDQQAQADIVETAGPNGVTGTISSNSWGNGASGQYGTYEAMFDDIVRDASAQPGLQPLLLVFSAGNSGPGASTLTRPKSAKNLLTVGATENYRPTQTGSTGCGTVTADNVDEVTCFSSRGPAGDGRFKPEILAPGSWIASGRAGSDSLWGNIDADHRYCTGTSQACPHVSGAAALVTQWWKDTHGGAVPSPALVKAKLINGTVDPAALATPVPNNTEGWGRLDLSTVLNAPTSTAHVDQTTVLTGVGEQYVLSGTVADPTKPFRVTLGYSDPSGAAGANPARVNDLDLTVTVGGVTYKGNVFASGVSTPGGAADTKNTTENVFLPAGAVGPFSITVTATQLNGDGALETGDATDQHFALVAYNAATTVTAGTDTVGAYAAAAGVFWLRNANAGGPADVTVAYGPGGAGWVPLSGDWDGDGDDTPGLYDPATGGFLLRNANAPGPADVVALFGPGGAGWMPVTGDWDGNGTDTIGLYDPTTGFFYLKNANTAGPADTFFGYGPGGAGWLPLAGDWDNNGTDTVGLYEPVSGFFFLKNANAAGPADAFFGYGPTGATPLAGDWDGNGGDTVGVYSAAAGVYFLKNSNAPGPADVVVGFGPLGVTPLEGDWDGQ